MFKLVGVQDALFAVQDTDDDVIDIVPKSKLCRCLNLGLEIAGVSRISSTEFNYTEEFFPKEVTSQDYDFDTLVNDIWYDYCVFGLALDDIINKYKEQYTFGEDVVQEIRNAINQIQAESEEYSDDDDDDYDSYFISSDDITYEAPIESEEDEEGTEDSNDYDEYYNDDDDYYNDDEDDDYYDDYYNDDDEEEEEEESTVNKLYRHLDEEQVKLLKRYYLWFSQRIFDEGQQQKRTLQITSNPRKLKKQQELNAMKNQGGMWAYAGFIDMGRRGADCCTLGHPLRYVHLAWDVSVADIETSFFGEEYNSDIEKVVNSNNCIKFGIDCISDFFEIDREYTDRLRRAQREALKDMDFMCQYYENGLKDEVVSSFTVMDDIINQVVKIDARGLLVGGKDYKCLVPRGLSSFYRQFRQLGMIVPKSLVQEIRDNLIGWENHKFIGWKYPNWNVLLKVLKEVLGKSSESFLSKLGGYSYGYTSQVNDYLVEFFQLKSCGYYEFNADTFKEEGGASKPVKAQLYAIHKSVSKGFWADHEYSFDYLRKLMDLDKELNRVNDVLDTLKVPRESFNNEENKYYIDSSITTLDYDAMKHYDEEYCNGFYDWFSTLRGLGRSMSGICKEGYNTCRSLSDFMDSLSDTLQKVLAEADNYQAFALKRLQESLDIMNSKLENERKAKEERERQRELEAQQKAEEEAKKKETASNLTDEEIRQYCYDNASKVKGNSKLKFALTVLDTVKKTGKCSDKQMYYINQIYTELSGVQLEDKRQASKISLDDRKDIEDAIDKVLADPDLLENENDKEKVYAILTSIKKYRSISERQMKYAEIALKVAQ